MPKNLVVCCDGTGNQLMGDHTNVLKLWCALDRKNPAEQLAYYDPGVGTMGDTRMWTKLGRGISRTLDAAVGRKVGENVGEAYGFLMRNYQPGDRVYLFGFSRGAYTVRALAGLIHMFGLAQPGSENLLPYLWLIYSDEDGTAKYKRERFGVGKWFGRFTRPMPIHFMGVWDTVSSRGWFFVLDSLPHTATNPSIAHIRHAVSIDERRAAFRQNLFQPSGPGPKDNKDVKEVWFPGVHSDVGGGYKDAESGLARLALGWMLREAEACQLDVDPENKAAMLQEPPAASDPDARARQAADARLHSSLTWGWWFLEFLPRRRWFRKDGKYHWRMNLFRRREIPAHARLHWSVRERCRLDPRYRPAIDPARHLIEE